MTIKVDTGEVKFEVVQGDTDVDPNGVVLEEELDFKSIEIDGKSIEFCELSREQKEEVRELINYYR
jgi:hypothetical protein